MLRLFNHYVSKLLIFSFLTEFLIIYTCTYTSILATSYFFSHALFTQEPIIGQIYFHSTLIALLIHMSLIATGLYQRDFMSNAASLLNKLLLSGLASFVLYNIYCFFMQLNHMCYHTQAITFPSTLLSIYLFRFFIIHQAEASNQLTRILVLGSGKKARELENYIFTKSYSIKPFDKSNDRIWSFVELDNENDILINQSIKLPPNEETDFLSKYTKENNIKKIVVAMDDRRKSLPIDQLLDCKLNGIEVIELSDYFERQKCSIDINKFSPNNLIFSDTTAQNRRYNIKRLSDIFSCLFIFALTFPIMLMAAIIVYIESGFKGPVLYRQTRVGLNGKHFQIIKFRSMIENAEKDGKAVWASTNDTRITSFGKIMRKTRIDELPQLFNVLKGDMSLVGPRPERPEFVNDLKTTIPYYDLRHYVMPGITGWAQTCYSYGASHEDSRKKLEFDLYYVKHHSIFLDILILFQTMAVVLWGKGAR